MYHWWHHKDEFTAVCRHGAFRRLETAAGRDQNKLSINPKLNFVNLSTDTHGFKKISNLFRSPDSAVGIVATPWIREQRNNDACSREGNGFHSSGERQKPYWGPSSPLFNWYWRVFPRGYSGVVVNCPQNLNFNFVRSLHLRYNKHVSGHVTSNTPNPFHILPLTTTEVCTSVSLHYDLRQKNLCALFFPLAHNILCKLLKGKRLKLHGFRYSFFYVCLLDWRLWCPNTLFINSYEFSDVTTWLLVHSRQSFGAVCCLHILRTHFGPEHGRKKSLSPWRRMK